MKSEFFTNLEREIRKILEDAKKMDQCSSEFKAAFKDVDLHDITYEVSKLQDDLHWVWVAIESDPQHDMVVSSYLNQLLDDELVTVRMVSSMDVELPNIEPE